ncbi:MAG: DUF6896 domain-containing protein [Sphingobacterium sp.]
MGGFNYQFHGAGCRLGKDGPVVKLHLFIQRYDK